MRRRWPALLAALALAAAVAWLYAGRELEALTGARLQRLPDDPEGGDRPLAEHRVAGIELPRHGQEHLPWRRVRARYLGYLQLGAAGSRELRLVANAEARLRVDGREVLARSATAAAPSQRIQLDLPAGSHALDVDYDAPEGPHVLRLLVAEPGGTPARLAREQLFPDPPGPETLARARRAGLLRRAAGPVLLVTGLLLLLRRVRREHVWRTAPLFVVAAAALLRLEALVNLQWQEQAPLALRRLAVSMWELHPAGLRLVPGPPGYEGDPFTYLRFAREMRGFYDAHVREPVFVATARGFIALLGGANVGLALASAFYSTLLVAATYALGASFFSRGVGLLAALALALERQSVGFSVLGWRDDAFAFFTVLTLVALRRLADEPGFARALIAGLVAALACLTRITALAYVVPCFVLALLLARRAHGRRAHAAFGIGALVLAAALLPYLAACWIAFGDPFFSINAHTVFYRGRAGLPYDTPMNVVRFLGYERGPFELLDTALQGLTSYPFLNKWADFDDWVGGASLVLPAASLVGLFGFAFVPRARLLLLALFASLLPYAVTWEVPGGAEWRFTLHAYPFYLVAAFWATGAVFRRDDRKQLLRALAAGALALPVAWLLGSGLHFLRVREELRDGKPAFVRAGFRDAFLLARGWGRLRRFENGFAREAGPEQALLRLPLVGGRAYRVTLRLRAAGACPTPCAVELALDGSPLGRHPLEPQAAEQDARFGSTPVPLAAAQVKDGFNLLELRGGPVDFWMARVEAQPP